ncbi:hypothetical protein BCR36DRAFT_158445 [Piromyces finnis]|uniref:Uncharacterized protein n=1 Tax=Piromyces finnis TaxID=1754191 RepID=A0A1Y1UYU5_9FUNG|nr:hypothetical protein BCR36DRAFT_158445 [Piromyces finnis]|eukprot:ORX42490.1 hypothetical protein BCR36DRAFT_158445 [Piromyces finnis]
MTLINNENFSNFSSKITSRISKRSCYYHCRNEDISLFGLITVCIFGVLVFSFILYLFVVLIIGCCRRRKNRIDIEIDDDDDIHTEYETPLEQTAGNCIRQQKYPFQHGYYYPPPSGYYPPPPPSFAPHGPQSTYGRGRQTYPQFYYYAPFYQSSRHQYSRPECPPPHRIHPPSNFNSTSNNNHPSQNNMPSSSFPMQPNFHNEDENTSNDNNKNNTSDTPANTDITSTEVTKNTA